MKWGCVAGLFASTRGLQIPWLPIAPLFYLAGALAMLPSAMAQDINQIISSNLRDLKSKNADVRVQDSP